MIVEFYVVNLLIFYKYIIYIYSWKIYINYNILVTFGSLIRVIDTYNKMVDKYVFEKLKKYKIHAQENNCYCKIIIYD